jgi:hypothetical protein
MLDVLITGGTVIDGSGAPGRVMDVGIVGDRIAAVEPLAGAQAARVIAATGLVVAPGFIDIHSHSDFTLLADPRAASSITQGVTLEVVGNCGYGCSVIGDPLLAREAIYIPIGTTDHLARCPRVSRGPRSSAAGRQRAHARAEWPAPACHGRLGTAPRDGR